MSLSAVMLRQLRLTRSEQAKSTAVFKRIASMYSSAPTSYALELHVELLTFARFQRIG